MDGGFVYLGLMLFIGGFATGALGVLGAVIYWAETVSAPPRP